MARISRAEALGLTSKPPPEKPSQTITEYYSEMYGLEMPEFSGLSLSPYEGDVRVSLTPGEKEAERLSTRLITGEEGDFRRKLSGVPDYAQVDRLVGIQERQLQENLLPQINSQLGTAGLLTSGASRRARLDANLGVADQAAQLRFDAYRMAKEESLQAAQILPSLTGIAGMTRNNEINNILRDMEKHYRNQGLEVQEWEANFKVAAQTFASSMALAEFAQDEAMRQAQAEAAKAKERSGLFSSLGSLIGGVAGFAIGGPMGAALGSQLGGAAGSGLGGDYGAATNQGTSALETWAEWSLYQEGLKKDPPAPKENPPARIP